ncbi:hypothetical protein ACFV0C_08415 [Streptomyces sp. NPDC059568]|uniref:hypothetical protein n=1 Tax=Streptomyces sp. NPDC059568 TaxID=3346868 RepID=UPI00369A8CFE
MYGTKKSDSCMETSCRADVRPVGSMNVVGAALRIAAPAPPRDALVHDVRTRWTTTLMD